MATIEDSLLPYLREKGDATVTRDDIYNRNTFDVFFDLMKFHFDIEAEIADEKVREEHRKAQAAAQKNKR